jgi:segregation and condensation protein B
MSLKAKLEAVIYAAEEPVTLAQLAALFAADAFEWKAQQEAAHAKLASEAASEAAQPLPPASEEAASLELKLEPADYDSFEPALSAAAAEPIPSAEHIPAVEQAPDAEPMQGASPEAGLEASPNSSSDFSSDFSPEPDEEVSAQRLPETNPEPEPETNPEAGPTASSSGPAAAGDAPGPAGDATADAELEARREARLRDREARAILRQLLDELIAEYASDGRGVEIREIAGGYRMATKPECHDTVRLFVKSLKPALKLSLPALETLAVIAYKQPVTAPEVNEIRGVDSSGVFGSLLARKLISTAGRKQVVGRPILYKTTREFLLRFGLKDLSELPSMEEFEKMAVLSLDEAETNSAAGEESERRSNPALGPEFDEAASEELEDSPSEDLPPQAAPQSLAPASEEPSAGSPAISTEPTPEKAAPAAPSPLEQAETETFPHGE